MDRLGLGYDVLKAAKPDIIYASASGYGADGPYAELPGQDLLIQARTGLVAATAGQQPEILPSAAGCAVVDQHGAALFALGIAGALYRRQATGQGARVESSLFNAGIDLQQESITAYVNGRKTPEVYRRDAHLATWFHEAPYGIFGSADGRHLALSLNDLAALSAVFEELGGGAVTAAPRERLRNFSGDKYAHRDTIAADIGALIGAVPWLELEASLSAKKIWFAPVLNYSELLEDPQARHNGIFVKHEVGGETATLIAHPNRYDGKAPAIRYIAEDVSADREEILADYGFAPDEVGGLVAKGIVG
jgi:crotonobetainyl-CoA:carnitine CoA-transferase CaiB-like acyl-CoA transferase